MHKNLPWLGIGSTIDILNEKFVCVGLFRSEGYLSGEVWTTRAAVLTDPRRYALSVVYLETPSKAAAQSVIARINGARDHVLKALTVDELHAKMVGDQSHLLEVLTVIFALVVGGALFASASFLSLLQRSRISEHCTLRAMGFPRRTISSFILWETELLSLCGGAIGIALAALALRNYSVESVGPTATPAIFEVGVSWSLAGLSLAVMFVIGVLGALTTLIRAARVSITAGLREE
jgi:ABC-type antimicrobial peptide transport system permease subunit